MVLFLVFLKSYFDNFNRMCHFKTHTKKSSIDYTNNYLTCLLRMYLCIWTVIYL